MPLPTPKLREDKNQFINRCRNDERMKKEYPRDDQREAICYSQWREAKGNKTQ